MAADDDNMSMGSVEGDHDGDVRMGGAGGSNGAADGAPAVAGPNQTIYVSNLNEKINKDLLKKALHAAFSQYGTIIDIVALKTLRLRGQAWIVFDNVRSAETALSRLQGFQFFDKPMRLQFAKTKSDAVARAEGTFVPRELKRKQDAQGGGASKAARDEHHVIRKNLNAPPNKKLFIQNLPADATSEALTKLFSVHTGFKEARVAPGSRGVAFVDFDNEAQSTLAMQALNKFRLGGNELVVSYAKK